METSQAVPGEIEPVSFRCDKNVLSVDVETWQGTPCVEETAYLLELFGHKRARATFFVLGSVARDKPELVRRIAAEGHEVGSHGWDHVQIFKKSPGKYRDEMQRSFKLLSDLVGSPIAGYRAPHFSIGPSTYWALDALADIGFKYDSSIFPGPRHGLPQFPRRPVRIVRQERSIVEVPLSTVRRFGTNLPVAGGGYLRLLPYPLIERAIRVVNEDGLPFVIYCHPYEFQLASLVRPPASGILGRVRSAAKSARANLLRRTMRPKLTRLLDAFRFTSFREALRDELQH